MKKNLLLILLVLSACSPEQTINSTPTSIAIASTPPSTPTIVLPPTVSSTTLPPTLTSTPTQFPCNPLAADFCITNGHFILQRPISPPANIAVDRIYPFASTDHGTRDPHHGVEFVNESGTPVYAAGEGVIIFAGPDDAPVYSPWRVYYGNLVVLQHEGDLYTLYAHLSEINVREGESVEAGEQIGRVGRSGVAIGSHLHFEVRRGNVEEYSSAVNPELWLVPSSPELGVIEIVVMNEKSEFQKAALTIQHLDELRNVIGVNYVDTYHPSLALGDENAAIGDLPAGRYRITLIFNGHLYDRTVEVQSGKLTQVVIVVK